MKPCRSILIALLLLALLPSLTACLDASARRRSPGYVAPDAGHTLDAGDDASTGGDADDDVSTPDAASPEDTGTDAPDTDNVPDTGPDAHGPDAHGPDAHGPDTHGPDAHGGDTSDDADADTGDEPDTGHDADTGGEPDTGPPVLECLERFGAAEACGGEPFGIWTIAEMCTDIGYDTLIQSLCPGAIIHDLTFSASGRTEITATRFIRDVTLATEGNITFPESCVTTGSCATLPQTMAVVFPGAEATCRSVGFDCNCDVTLTRTDRSSSTDYTFHNGLIFLGNGRRFYYCVAGSLTLRETGLSFPEPEVTEYYAP